MYTNRDTTPLSFHYFFWFAALPVSFFTGLYALIKMVSGWSSVSSDFDDLIELARYVDSSAADAMSTLRTVILFLIVLQAVLLILSFVAFVGFFGWRNYGYSTAKALLTIRLIIAIILSLIGFYWLIEIINIANDPSGLIYSAFSGEITEKPLLLTGIGVIAYLVEKLDITISSASDLVMVALFLDLAFILVTSIYSAILRYYSRRKLLFSESYTPVDIGAGARFAAPSAPPVYHPSPSPSRQPIRSTMPSYPAASAPPVSPTTKSVWTPERSCPAAAAAEEPQKMQFCTGCGAVVQPGRNFCTACGTPVRAVVSPPPAPRMEPSGMRTPTPPARRSAPTSPNHSGFMTGGDL